MFVIIVLCLVHSMFSRDSYTKTSILTVTYDHCFKITGLPVRSAILKLESGLLVVAWVTSSESRLSYVFVPFAGCVGLCGSWYGSNDSREYGRNKPKFGRLSWFLEASSFIRSTLRDVEG